VLERGGEQIEAGGEVTEQRAVAQSGALGDRRRGEPGEPIGHEQLGGRVEQHLARGGSALLDVVTTRRLWSECSLCQEWTLFIGYRLLFEVA
jgi:hypothetical protein